MILLLVLIEEKKNIKFILKHFRFDLLSHFNKIMYLKLAKQLELFNTKLLLYLLVQLLLNLAHLLVVQLLLLLLFFIWSFLAGWS